jgi:hypothetical protein
MEYSARFSLPGSSAMTALRVDVSAVIEAPPARVYGVLADYRGAHRRILPRFFDSMVVEKGGVGEGTVIRVTSRVLGVRSELRMEVAEPEPRRVLTESDLARGLVTAFIVDAEGAGSRVTINTIWHASNGIAGWFEKRIMPPLLRRVYREELELLAAEARR